MSCITPTKRFDMWFSERSVKTTEYSSRPSGSTDEMGLVGTLVHSENGEVRVGR